jgi:hypothetical protein
MGSAKVPFGVEVGVDLAGKSEVVCHGGEVDGMDLARMILLR